MFYENTLGETIFVTEKTTLYYHEQYDAVRVCDEEWNEEYLESSDLLDDDMTDAINPYVSEMSLENALEGGLLSLRTFNPIKERVLKEFVNNPDSIYVRSSHLGDVEVLEIAGVKYIRSYYFETDCIHYIISKGGGELEKFTEIIRTESK